MTTAKELILVKIDEVTTKRRSIVAKRDMTSGDWAELNECDAILETLNELLEWLSNKQRTRDLDGKARLS